MTTIDCSNMPKGATHKSLGTGRWYRYESGEGAYSKGWYRSAAAGNLWVKMHMGKAAQANLVEVPNIKSKPTEAGYGMAPLKVEGGSYVPFPDKYTDLIPDGGLDPRNRALNSAAKAHAEERNRIIDQALWDEFGSEAMKKTTPLSTQVGGGHYKDLKIQPVEYIHANSMPFIEGCVVKYVTRHRAKNGKADIEKAIHFLQILLELEYGSAPKELKAPSELKFVAKCVRCGVEAGELHKVTCPLRGRPKQTRRQQLIAAGIPAHEFDGIADPALDEFATGEPSISLEEAFIWEDTKQGKEHWEKWQSLLD